VNSIFLLPTTPEEILTFIKMLHSETSCGNDDIPVRILKLRRYLQAPMLSIVINECVSNSVFFCTI